MSDMLPAYSVTVSREDNLWVAVVDGLPGGATDVERFEDLHDAVHDLIATLQDVEPGNFWVEWRFRQGSFELFDELRELRQWEKQTELALANRDAARRAVIGTMRQAGLSYREIADVIGMSHQRVSQLLEGDSGADVRFSNTAAQFKRWAGSHARTLQRLAGSRSHDLSSTDVPPPGQFYMTPLEVAILLILDSALQLSPRDRRSLLMAAAKVLEDVAKDDGFLLESAG
jgi:transcriptional regulator with XRE-family HTH domain